MPGRSPPPAASWSSSPASERIQDQLRVTGVTDLIGSENIYTSDERIGATARRAYADAAAWIKQNQRAAGTDAR